MENNNLYPLILKPTIKPYIWGGATLKPYFDAALAPDNQPIAEVWAIYEKNQVLNGFLKGMSLTEVLHKYPVELLGKENDHQGGLRFPILIKLLDCQDWLSIQVHPDDTEAIRLEGKGFRGKTEAWFFIDCKPDAQIIAGTREGITPAELKNAIETGSILNVLNWHQMVTNDFIFIPARTVHALGPGSLVYELQQSSDITYRVYDWDRSPQTGRELHIEKSLQTAMATMTQPSHLSEMLQENTTQELIDCPYFHLEYLRNLSEVVSLDTNFDKMHAITVIQGNAEILTESGIYTLRKFESLLIPAAVGSYRISGEFELLLASNK